MIKSKLFSAALACLAWTPGFVFSQNKPAPPPLAKLDKGKGGIEFGPKAILAKTAAGQPIAPAPTPANTKADPANPKVEPGKVKWHADFAAACQASAKSGKPVLLFQMMGKLDDQFC